MKDIQVHLRYGKEETRYEEIMKITAETYLIAAKKILDKSALTMEEKKQLLMGISKRMLSGENFSPK